MDSRDANNDGQPFYVNAKQYHRILKRRIARARLEESLRSAPGRRPYLHESRHKHAMRRPRGQGGRFLTAAEIAEKQRQEENGEHTSDATPHNESPNTNLHTNESRTESSEATELPLESSHTDTNNDSGREASDRGGSVASNGAENDAFQYAGGIKAPLHDIGAPVESSG